MNEEELQTLVKRLERAEAEHGELVQFAVDELVFDNLGTGKWASDINNGSYRRQLEALIEKWSAEQVKGWIEELFDIYGWETQ